LHKAIILLVRADTKIEAKSQAETIIEDNLISESSAFDWYQGITTSQRWPEYNIFNNPTLAKPLKVRKLINDFLAEGSKEAREWITKGNKELAEKGDKNLGWTLASFHIAGGKTTAYVFDSDGESVMDKEHLENIFTNYDKPANDPLWVCMFDIHY